MHHVMLGVKQAVLRGRFACVSQQSTILRNLCHEFHDIQTFIFRLFYFRKKISDAEKFRSQIFCHENSRRKKCVRTREYKYPSSRYS